MKKNTAAMVSGATGALVAGVVMALFGLDREFSIPVRVLIAGAIGGITALALGKLLEMIRGSEPKDGDSVKR